MDAISAFLENYAVLDGRDLRNLFLSKRREARRQRRGRRGSCDVSECLLAFKEDLYGRIEAAFSSFLSRRDGRWVGDFVSWANDLYMRNQLTQLFVTHLFGEGIPSYERVDSFDYKFPHVYATLISRDDEFSQHLFGRFLDLLKSYRETGEDFASIASFIALQRKLQNELLGHPRYTPFAERYYEEGFVSTSLDYTSREYKRAISGEICICDFLAVLSKEVRLERKLRGSTGIPSWRARVLERIVKSREPSATGQNSVAREVEIFASMLEFRTRSCFLGVFEMLFLRGADEDCSVYCAKLDWLEGALERCLSGQISNSLRRDPSRGRWDHRRREWYFGTIYKYIKVIQEGTEDLRPATRAAISKFFEVALQKSVNSNKVVGDSKENSRQLVLLLDTAIKRDEQDAVVGMAAAIVGYINDKDHFSDEYVLRLKKRLLGHIEDANWVEKEGAVLNSISGSFDTGKIRNVIHHFLKQERNRTTVELPRARLSLSVYILNSAVFDRTNFGGFVPPDFLGEVFDRFVLRGTSKWDKKKVILHPSYSVLHVRFRAGRGGVYRLVLNLFQFTYLYTLIHFGPEELAKTRLGVSRDEFDGYTKLLSKYGLIVVDPGDGRAVGVNTGFSWKNKKLDISQKRPRIERRAEQKQLEKNLKERRMQVIEVTLVRIMKTNREMLHKDLVREAMRLIRVFRPSPKEINRVVQSLIDREYLERDPDNDARYKYLA